MSTNPSSNVLSGIAPAPKSEPSVTTERGFTDIFNITLTGKVSLATSIAELLKADMVGMARVELYSLSISYVLMKSGESIKCGLGSLGVTLTVDQAAMNEPGFVAVGTDLTIGRKYTEKLIVSDNWSKQIQPPSSMAPTFVLYLEASTNCLVTLHVAIKHDGPRVINSRLDLKG